MMNTLQQTAQQTALSESQSISRSIHKPEFKRFNRYIGILVGASALAVGMGITAPAFAMLQTGYSGAGVSNLQSTLASLGHYNGPITGYFGDLTRAAVMSYQVSHNLAPDGVVGDRTLNCLQMDAGTPPSLFSSASPPAAAPQSTIVASAPTTTTQSVSQPQVTTQPVFQPQAATQAVSQPQMVMMVPMMVTQAMPRQSAVTAPTTVTPANTVSGTVSTVTSQTAPTVSGARLGTSGPTVTEVQQLLGAMGYSVPITGYFGQMTQSAVISFQQANGLVADGVVGPQTLTFLRSGQGGVTSTSYQVASASTGSSSSLRMGTSGQQVTQLQQALARFGYSVPVTGYFGEMTQAAVMQFQAARGLAVDGVVGPATLNQLGI